MKENSGRAHNLDNKRSNIKRAEDRQQRTQLVEGPVPLTKSSLTQNGARTDSSSHNLSKGPCPLQRAVEHQTGQGQTAAHTTCRKARALYKYQSNTKRGKDILQLTQLVEGPVPFTQSSRTPKDESKDRS